MARRIVRRIDSSESVAFGGSSSSEPSYLDKLKDLIPTEIAVLYVAGAAVIPSEVRVAEVVWAVACLIFTIAYIAQDSRRAEGDAAVHPVAWSQVAVSSVSFVIWVYVLGGPFKAVPTDPKSVNLFVPWLGTLLMLGWTFVVPKFFASVGAVDKVKAAGLEVGS